MAEGHTSQTWVCETWLIAEFCFALDVLGVILFLATLLRVKPPLIIFISTSENMLVVVSVWLQTRVLWRMNLACSVAVSMHGQIKCVGYSVDFFFYHDFTKTLWNNARDTGQCTVFF